VNILCSVRDGNGRLISSLDKGDFEVREEGKRQEILYFTRETDRPLTVGLLVDSSVSQGVVIEEERRAAAAFFAQVLRQRDAAFLISFDNAVELLQDVTGSIPLLQNALETVRARAPVAPVGPFPPPIQAGGTNLYDAVYLASLDVLRNEAGRKAMVVLSDGVDQGSKVEQDQAIDAAQRTDAAIYAIQFLDRGFYYDFPSAAYGGESTLKKMTEETGGRMFRASNDRELSDAFQQISDELRSQYSLGYSPTNAAKDGSYRRIEVRVKGRGFRVQARRGYYAVDDQTSRLR
jgi:VWFA-related protein